MLSINTNLSSLIAQNSMNSATKLLNQAVERMTTGYKINHAKDNAANYSISQKMNIQISSYDVAADNVAMGMDLVTTASDIINNMQDKATRLQALCTQARNGTYGAQSMAAINSEAGAIMAEITRLYQTAEYNNVSLFNREAYELTPEHKALTETLKNNGPKAKAEYNGFIEDPKTYTDEQVAAMTKVADVSTFSSGQKYSISSVEELQKLADYVNAGNDTTGVEYVLGADIDLSSIDNWTPIGSSSYQFKGTFDGNGHTISNLTINNETKDNQGLFALTARDSAIQNIGLVDCNVNGKDTVGGLVGSSYGTITNSYATGSVNGAVNVGGLAGFARYAITNCYMTGDVSGQSTVGGLVAHTRGDITNCYATGSVSGADYTGGLVGYAEEGSFTNCYATGSVSGADRVGGLVGYAFCASITSSYTTGSVGGTSVVGGIIGFYSAYNGDYDYTFENVSCYSRSITGSNEVGSIIGGWAGEEFNGYYTPATITMTNVSTTSTLQTIGSYYTFDYDEYDYTLNSTYDLNSYNSIVTHVLMQDTTTSLQVGINSDTSCQITFDTNFKFDLSAIEGNIASDEALAAINDFTNLLSEKSTQLGAVQNRLDSALESITVNMENLTSSLSTIRDADIAEVSSEYIRQQILQQASATLMATANQAPSIALQLI